MPEVRAGDGFQNRYIKNFINNELLKNFFFYQLQLPFINIDIEVFKKKKNPFSCVTVVSKENILRKRI
jgi:hypothetical protein